MFLTKHGHASSLIFSKWTFFWTKYGHESRQCFFLCVKKKVCVKRFFGFFWRFFTHKKCFSRTKFIKFSRTLRRLHRHFVKIFHGWAVFCFTGWNRNLTVLCVKIFWKIWFSQNFHAQNGFFTGTFYDFFTEGFAFSRKENQYFSRTSATFSRTKKKHWIEPLLDIPRISTLYRQ